MKASDEEHDDEKKDKSEGTSSCKPSRFDDSGAQMK